MKHFFLALLLVATACSMATPLSPSAPAVTATVAASATPEPTAPPTSTATPAPTATPEPTNSPQPTPYPPLQTDGPYLAYLKRQGEQQVLVLLDADGVGRKLIPLPAGAYVQSLETAISPNGKWLAFHTGSYETPYDLSLNLLNLVDTSIYRITPLLSKDFLKNFDELDQRLPAFDNNRYSSDMNWADLSLASFALGIFSVSWSKDSQFLAFSGEMDGPSSDLYVYELRNQSIIRLTDDLLNIGSIDWSPYDSRIVISNVIPSLNYNGNDYYALRFNKTPLPKLVKLDNGYWISGRQWVSPDLYFFYDSPDGCCGPYNLRYINVTSGEATVLWQESSAGYAIDPETLKLAVSAAPEASIAGSYLVDNNGREQKITDMIFWNIGFRGGITARFLGFDGEITLGISSEGEISPISEKEFSAISVSPNKKWFLLYQLAHLAYEASTGIELFSEDDRFVRTITDTKAQSIAWRPDSQGFFFTHEIGFFYVEIPDGEPMLIDNEMVIETVWVNP